MITINVISVNEVKYLNGKIGKENYSVVFSEELKQDLIALSIAYNDSDTVEQANEVLAVAMEKTSSVKQSMANSSSLTEVLKGDLVYNIKTNKYHVISDGKTSKAPVHKFFADKMIEANDKGLSPKPWLVFWVRLMRNPLYTTDKEKVNNLVNYLSTQYVDEESTEKLIEDGYSRKIAKELSTYDQISITEEGILAAFKYAKLIDEKFVVKKDDDGNQYIDKVPMYERTLEVDPITGEVTKDELDLPTVAEDFFFLPPIQGESGNAFTCKELNDTSEAPKLGHVIKIGRIHELSKGFDQVNTNDDRSCVPGLHLGGYYYVKSYSGISNYLIDCLVAPEDIGAVCDANRDDSDGAIRCRRYMAVGGHFAVSRGMYHPSKYAKLLDEEWGAIKLDAIEKLNKAIEDTTDLL